MNVAPLVAALALAFAASPSNAAEPVGHAHGHAGHDVPVQVAADHVRWAPDAPLMAGMRRVHDAVEALHHLEMGHMSEPQVLEQAAEVDSAIAYMFANCELPAEPDAALHGVLARLMTGSRALKADPTDASPVAGMREAVADYPRLFEDPGFGSAGQPH